MTARAPRPDFDADAYKADQRVIWDRAASKWQWWWPVLESALAPVSAALLDLANVEPGDRVLDIATGIGEPAASAARRVGPAGAVVGVDISPGTLAVAAQRADELGLANIEWILADAETIELEAGSFDSALCRLGFMCFPHLADHLERLRRLVVDGGRIAAAVWGPPGRCPALTTPLSMVSRFIELPSGVAGEPRLFGLGQGVVLEDEFAFAGFEEVRTERVRVVFQWASPEEFTRFHQVAPIPIQTVLDSEHDERQAQIWDGLTRTARTSADRDGCVRLSAEVVLVAGTRTRQSRAGLGECRQTG